MTTKSKSQLAVKEIVGMAILAVIIFFVIGGGAILFDALAGPTCSLQTHDVRVDDRQTMLAVIRQDSDGTNDLPTDFLVQTMEELNPDIDPGSLHPSTILVVPDECKLK